MKIDQIVAGMEPRRHTRRMAAKALGLDPDTLRYWKRQGIYAPTDRRRFGQLEVDLYSDEDIEAMREIAKTNKPGPKPKPAPA